MRDDPKRCHDRKTQKEDFQPTLKERTLALMGELLEAPPEEQVKVILALMEKLERELDAIAEATRSPSEPVGCNRIGMDEKGKRHGKCVCHPISRPLRKTSDEI
jgi:hypothetical protein